MKLAVHVLGREVGILEPVGRFKSVFTYHANANPDDFLSLTMPVRTESYRWDAPLHPIFQMNLPEGYLLQVLQEKFGPQIGADPTALLSVIGRHMIGRLQVAAPGAKLDEPPQALEVADLLQGDNSERAFAELVRQHATSGVSGVIPKFLEGQDEPFGIDAFNKTTLFTGRYIIKGSSRNLPFAALNEHLCMQVAAKILPATKTQISEDGKALVVHRFDIDDLGHPKYGMEDFCVLLGLPSSAKYGTAWERIAKAIRDHVPGVGRIDAFRYLALTLFLTYALRNADCHAKNIALLYTTRADVRMSPVYDMLTTVVYPGHQDSPPGISFLGKKTWKPGRNLKNFITAQFGVPLREQNQMVEAVSDAVSDTVPLVRQAIEKHPEFRNLGKHMLLAWEEGVTGLRDKRLYSLGAWKSTEPLKGISDPPKLKNPKKVIGRSEGLGQR
ncbi:MAG: type II toxin-antitoxin system HipA family toxin [Methylacidiphilales bacterium]|nr:type II toxin-antitoxin system HipA family toxin [Candidatus Methylacidiphilales bacterium]